MPLQNKSAKPWEYWWPSCHPKRSEVPQPLGRFPSSPMPGRTLYSIFHIPYPMFIFHIPHHMFHVPLSYSIFIFHVPYSAFHITHSIFHVLQGKATSGILEGTDCSAKLFFFFQKFPEPRAICKWNTKSWNILVIQNHGIFWVRREAQGSGIQHLHEQHVQGLNSVCRKRRDVPQG